MTEFLKWPLMSEKSDRKIPDMFFDSVKRVTESLTWPLMSVKKSDRIPNIAFEKKK